MHRCLQSAYMKMTQSLCFGLFFYTCYTLVNRHLATVFTAVFDLDPFHNQFLGDGPAAVRMSPLIFFSLKRPIIGGWVVPVK